MPKKVRHANNLKASPKKKLATSKFKWDEKLKRRTKIRKGLEMNDLSGFARLSVITEEDQESPEEVEEPRF